jgi:hypothetical protein
MSLQELGLEWSSAVISSFFVAPAISIVDKAIIENASGVKSLGTSFKDSIRFLVTSPIKFAKSPAFLLIWGVYGGTYITGNTIEMIYRTKVNDLQESVRPRREQIQQMKEQGLFAKFLGSSIANVGLSVGKDRIYTKMFGNPNVKPGKFPKPSFALFSVRDSMTILAGFILPDIISKRVQESTSLSKYQSDTICQLSVPCAMQFVSSPLHLIGIDLYNRPDLTTFKDRLDLVRREYWRTSWARVGRIFPAFGVGGVINKKLRRDFGLIK